MKSHQHCVRSGRAARAGRPGAPAGFTLIEMSIVLIIIVMLSSLVLVAASRAMQSARRSAERQTLVSLKQAITQFKNTFDMLPPLVHDNAVLTPETEDPNPPSAPWPTFTGGSDLTVGPVDNPDGAYRVIAMGQSKDPMRRANERAYLQGFDGTGSGSGPIVWDYRFSMYSLAYYLMGALDVIDPDRNKPLDGAVGSKFTAVAPDGTFTGRGKAYEAFFDVSQHARRLSSPGGSPPNGARITFNDRWGRPIRYYRWEPRPAQAGAAPGSPESRARTLVPRAAGDPRKNPELRSAGYALVILGENRYTDMRAPIEVGIDPVLDGDHRRAVEDDIVEVGE